MSTLIAEICMIESITDHPNADRLSIIKLKGKSWNCISAKIKNDKEYIHRYQSGILVSYIPVDALIPDELANKLNITKYLGKNGRVRAADLRGVTSYGFVFENEHDLDEGSDITELYNIKKFEPTIDVYSSDTEPCHELFHKYTGIENIKNFSDHISEETMIVANEKVHGTNCIHFGFHDNGKIKYLVGSHFKQRKKPTLFTKIRNYFSNKRNVYWETFDKRTKMLINELLQDAKVVRVYKEIYGHSIQKGFVYRMGKEINQVIIDINVDDKYLDYDQMVALCCKYHLPTPPVLYRGPFNYHIIDEIIQNTPKTIIGNGDNLLEGVVIRPIKEDWNEELGRVILKWISDRYYLKADETTEFH